MTTTTLNHVLVAAALDAIRRQNPDGLLLPEEVEHAAHDPASPLHDYFTWDDTEAAYRYRLNQARHLIVRVYVQTQVMPTRHVSTGIVQNVPQYSSLHPQEAGYYSIEQILTDPELAAAADVEFDRELRALLKRYAAKGIPAINAKLTGITKALGWTSPCLWNGVKSAVGKK